MSRLSEQEEFFYEHAGYSWNPATQREEEGRQETAKALAAAEVAANELGVEFVWESDWDVGSHVEYYGESYRTEPETCESCCAWLRGDLVASLGCIDDASPEYVRVVEAELALEVLCLLGGLFAMSCYQSISTRAPAST